MTQKFRFHVLGLPHTVSNKEYVACAYTQKVVKFCKMMKARGHYIMHYGHEESNVDCDEHITVTTNETLKKAYGSYDWRKEFFKHASDDFAHRTFYANSISEIHRRKQRNDFLLPFWGWGHKPVCDAHNDLIVVEPGIGYSGGQFARWRVYESYAIMHGVEGPNHIASCNKDWYHVVIPNYFDLSEFEYKEKKEDYFLYLGRIYTGKGVHIAYEVCRNLGVKLKIAGQGDIHDIVGKKIPDNVEYIGYADVQKRKELMSNAKASFLVSMYNEPFGGVQIENLLCGTPTITSDWGAFAENNLHGVTGYRCRTYEDFVLAVRDIDKIKPKDCRVWGENFSLDKVSYMYEKYFRDVYNVYTGKGWYAVDPTEAKLDWLCKTYPRA
jgi:glycosyltransferase involved in cell wall biosynthesis